MATYKCTILFRSGANGWSESWYWQSASPDFPGAQRALEALIPPRMLLCGYNTYCAGYRVHDMGVHRATVTKTNNSTIETAADNSDFPSATIVAQVLSDDRSKRVVYLRGYPDSWVYKHSSFDRIVFSATATTAFQTFVAYLYKSGWRFRATERRGGEAVGTPLFGFADVGGWLAVNVAEELWAPGMTMKIRYVEASIPAVKKLVNRTFLVRAAEFNQVVLNTKANLYGDLDKLTGGLAWRSSPAYYPITGGQLVRVGARRAGRAFFVPPGHRPAR